MPNIMSGSLNGQFSGRNNYKLSILSVLINNNCNLKCRHCYLKARKFGTYLTHEEWRLFFVSLFMETRPETLCFAGKEVFFDRESAEILFDAIRLRNSTQQNASIRTQIGLITNGIMIRNFKEDLLETPPDYIDISIDGLPHIHDDIRGAGSFEALRSNVHWLRDNYNGNLWVTHTILQNNLQSLPQFIKYLYQDLGITKFSIGLYKEKPYTDSRLKIEKDDLFLLLDKALVELRQLQLDRPIEVLVELDITHKEFLPLLIQSGWVQNNEPFSSTIHCLGDSVRLTFNVANVPVGLWRSVRITPEGLWLAADDLMEVKNYPGVATSNIRDFHFSSQEAYINGLQSRRFYELTKDHQELGRTILQQLTYNQPT